MFSKNVLVMANLNQNLINLNVDDELKADIVAAVNALVLQLNFLIQLTEEEREGKKAVQDHLIGFCQDMHQAMIDLPQCKPGPVDLTRLVNDISVWDLTKSIRQKMDSLYRKLVDTQLQSGHEAYQAASMGYKMLELFGSKGDTDCMTRYKDIQGRYFNKMTGRPKGDDGNAPQ